ncbi:hypothetical protein, partial [Pseudomonas viridiflava]|uniref:hypothetical protein n=1 Tax=Pseudomonas viridiflava TaxID=33069 RepID=UPI0019824C3D
TREKAVARLNGVEFSARRLSFGSTMVSDKAGASSTTAALPCKTGRHIDDEDVMPNTATGSKSRRSINFYL